MNGEVQKKMNIFFLSHIDKTIEEKSIASISWYLIISGSYETISKNEKKAFLSGVELRSLVLEIEILTTLPLRLIVSWIVDSYIISCRSTLRQS